jgi:predicted AAA+ superfamily ATPase
MVIRELYLKRIRPFYHSELIKVITGVRRCGKSTVILQIMDELKNTGINDEQIIYINFEDYKFHKLATADLLYEYLQQRIRKTHKTYLFIDEIQNVKNFELVINSFRATDDVSIFITGSNSKLLSGELASHLTGRTVEFILRPFTFKEYYDFQIKKGNNKKSDTILEEYLEWGGFPLVAQEDDHNSKHVILSNLFDSIVLKDIVLRNNISSPQALLRVLDYIIANSSTTVSGNSIAKALSQGGQNISAPTVYDYLKSISEACVCDLVQRYDIRRKTILSYQEKAYVCDLGFFKLRKNRVKDKFNYIIESLCYNELIARGYTVYIGKTHRGEVDFIAEKQETRKYFQVAYLLESEQTIEREFNGFLGIDDSYPKYLISMDKLKLSRDGIVHIPLMDWLLSPED